MPRSRSRSRNSCSSYGSRRVSRVSRRHSRSGSHRRSHSRRRSYSRSRSYSSIYPPVGTRSAQARRMVFNGKYHKTRGGLTKADLVENKYGQIVSRLKSQAGKSLQRKNPWKKNSKFMKYAGRVDEL